MTLENGLLVDETEYTVLGAPCEDCNGTHNLVWTADRIDYWFRRKNEVWVFCAVCKEERRIGDLSAFTYLATVSDYGGWFEGEFGYRPENTDSASITT